MQSQLTLLLIVCFFVHLEDELEDARNSLQFESEEESEQEDNNDGFDLKSFGGEKHPVDCFQDPDNSGVGLLNEDLLASPPSLTAPAAAHNLLGKTTPDSATRKHNISATKKKHKKSKAARKLHTETGSVSRPDSDKNHTQPLQQAKANQRRVHQQKRRGAQISNSQMPISTRTQRKADMEKDMENADKANPTGEMERIPRKPNETTSPAEVSAASSHDSEDIVGKEINAEKPAAAKRPTKVVKPTGKKITSKSKPSSQLDANNYSFWVKCSKYTSEDIDQLCADQRVKDHKLNKDDRKIQLDKCRRTILNFKAARGRDQVYIKYLEVGMNKMEERITHLEIEATQRVSRSKAAKLRICDEQKEKVLEKTKGELWRTTKFVTSKDQLENATEKVLDLLGLDKKTPEERDSWVVTYKIIVKKGLNSQRNYLTSELKKLSWEFLKAGQDLPPVGVLLACAMRQVSEVNEAKFKWYWTKALTKIVSAKQWNKEVYYYTTILKARMDMSDDASPWLFSISHEAMICLVWHNNWQKWQDQYRWQQDPNNKGKKMPNMPGLWSSSDSGQAEWGGWSEDGLKKYVEYKKNIRSSRKGRGEEISAFEQKILGELREEAGIECDSHEAQLRKERAKKRRLNSDKPVADIQVHKAVTTVEEEDEEDDEEGRL